VIARFAADPLFQATLHGVASLLFLSAALHKLRGPAEFRAALGGYGLLPTAARGIAGTGLAALELALGVALLIPATGGVAGAVGAALMLLYAAGIRASVLEDAEGAIALYQQVLALDDADRTALDALVKLGGRHG